MRRFNFNLLPSPADNTYTGYKIAFWFFIAFNALMTWRSIIHMFFEEFGVHEIANLIILSGDPNPMPLIYSFFSLWGFAQLIFCGVSWIVIFRYKSLISLMYLLYLIEWFTRVFLYPFLQKSVVASGIYSSGKTPGVELAPYITFLLILMLVFSMREQSEN